MTLIVAATGPESIWLLADRRISYEHRPPKDDARKILLLDTDDGKAILGYSGLGETSLGTEPADWMSAVLRGRRLALEQSLGVLADASKRQLPRHMVRLPKGGVAHSIIVPAFVHNDARLYSIDFVFSPDRTSYNFRYQRHVSGRCPPAKPRTPRFAVAGSGAPYLLERKQRMRDLLRILTAYDREQLSAIVVADHFAALNYEVYRGLQDKTVGPRCIVAWRNGRHGPRRGGGAHQFYTGTTRDASSPSLPAVANGTDVRALVEVIMPRMMQQLEALSAGRQPRELDKDEINADLARLPDSPDENLR